MILVDTNVISEPFRVSPNPAVSEWLNNQPLETLYLAAMTVAELRAGVAMMPASKRRATLNDGIEHTLLPLFMGRVVPFDVACTRAYAELLVAARKMGQTVAAADAVIAAIALNGGFMVATRDTTPFLAAGVKVINPWEAQE